MSLAPLRCVETTRITCSTLANVTVTDTIAGTRASWYCFWRESAHDIAFTTSASGSCAVGGIRAPSSSSTVVAHRRRRPLPRHTPLASCTRTPTAPRAALCSVSLGSASAKSLSTSLSRTAMR